MLQNYATETCASTLELSLTAISLDILLTKGSHLPATVSISQLLMLSARSSKLSIGRIPAGLPLLSFFLSLNDLLVISNVNNHRITLIMLLIILLQKLGPVLLRMIKIFL